MSNELRYDGKVAIVTGAGNGLGRSHALLLASRGAKVVVNDLGGSATGEGKSSAAADKVVAEIKEMGGEAVANYDSVEDGDKIVQTAMDTWGQIDILINNAGILRDISFAKLSNSDWDLVYRVHVAGTFAVTHAAWPHMREAQYGRIVMTSSAAGLYGNFGQANYSMAKLGVVGFGKTLAIEGAKRNIHVNNIAPIAGSRMTETILPQNLLDALKPEYVSPLVAYLCHESCQENGGTFEVGGGFYGKLRWERTEGKMFRVGRDIRIEDIASSWGQITDFSEVTHPGNVTESMAPIMANVNAGESKGGNEFIDVDEALGYEFPQATSTYDERDLSIYALGVGAAEDATDQSELRYVYEMHGDGFQPLPTYGVVPAINLVLDMGKRGETAPGMNYGLDRILHGEQYTEIVQPLPRSAKLRHKAKITDIFDKGKNALVITETKSYDEDDNLLIINRATTVVRGAGGWGGERGPTEEQNTPPDRAPDAVVEQQISPNQALLYRLSGDWNPLHADPGMATAFGFEKPILHGLCTYGYAGRHVINKFAPEGDPRYFKSISVRFADPVFPGETLVTKMWKEDGKVIFECDVKEREKTVISRAAIEFYDEIPKPAPKKVEAEAAPAEASNDPIAADVFTAIGQFIGEKPEMLHSIGKVYQFKLKNPESVWTLDLKAGAVAPGETVKPECTLELTDANFMDMCSGKADPMKLYMDGALKISGDLMASQKLDFLKQIDPDTVYAAAKARGGSGGGAPAAGGGASSAVEDVFIAIDAHVRANPDLAKSVGKVYQFALTEPDSLWTLDLKEGHVAAGETAKPECTLQLTTENFMAMTSGESDPMKLYMDGALKISGDLMASQKLDFLQKIDPEEAKNAVAEARAAGKSLGDSSTGGEAPKASIAAQFFENFENRITENSALAGEVAAVVHFNVTEPDSQWTLNFKDASEIKMGLDGNADVSLTISEDNLAAWSRGERDAANLHQTGDLRVDGDIGVVHRLGIMKDLI